LKRVILTGGSGFLGSHLITSLNSRYELASIRGLGGNNIELFEHKRNMSKILPNSLSSLGGLIHDFEPEIIINCSGLVGDIACETNKIEAYKANVDLVRNLARVASDLKAYFIHFSTDAVFGDELSERTEDDSPFPSTEYGLTKLNGELEAQRANENSIVLRTNFFGFSNRINKGLFNFYAYNLKQQKTINGYTNVLFNPTHIATISEAVEKLINMKLTGILHIAGNTVLSKFEFGQMVAESLQASSNLIKPHFVLSNSGTIRKYMYLNSNRFQELGISTQNLRYEVDLSVTQFERYFHEFI
jgi:dTDP-4-dehydrorhamnose reductase